MLLVAIQKRPKKCFKKCILLNPTEVSSYHSLGTLYQQIKEYEDAEKWLKRATEVELTEDSRYFIMRSWKILIEIYEIQKKKKENKECEKILKKLEG